ncbi:MAG TPA: DUF4405 domain-containing protein [Feifaniaceae bacterium]|nr:DUF4405 domain-containing protein [Feifaniaceae bacterium]
MKTKHNASQKRVFKLILDAVMLILLVLMYRKQAISIAFHEIGGLALVGLFIIHHLVNGKWIAAVTKRLFSKQTSGYARTCYIVNVLLLLAFLTVGVTGVLISKVVFSIHVSGNFKTLHYFSSALAVILMGVHLGLHADYIFGKLLKKGTNKIAKIALAVVLAAVLAFGGYSLFTSNFVSFLTAPLQASSFAHGEFQPSGDIALDGDSGQRPMDLSELPDAGTETNPAGPTQPDSDAAGDMPALPEGDASQTPQDTQSGTESTEGQTLPEGGSGGGQGTGGGQSNAQGKGGGESGSITTALLLIAQYVSIITLFAAVTYPIQKLLRKKGGKHPTPEQDAEGLSALALPEGGEEPSPIEIADGETKE